MTYPTAEQRERGRLVAWVMYDMTVNRMDRRRAFAKLRALGISPRAAAEEIQSYEREPDDV